MEKVREVHWTRGIDHSSTKIQSNDKKAEATVKEIAVHVRKYNSFRVYLRNILKTSLITSLPEIATSSSWAKRLVKIIVFILCVIGFVVQTTDFLKIYWSYPTVVNIEVSNPFQITQPSITVCNRNRHRRSVYCKAMPKNCVWWEEEDTFCEKFPRSCRDDRDATLGTPNITDYRKKYGQWDSAHNFSHTKDIIKECIKRIEGKNYPCGVDYYKVGFVTADGRPNLCYTIETQWGRPNEEPVVHTNTFSFTLIFDVEPEEYSIPTEPVHVQISVHDRRMLVNPYAEGYLLTGGNVYNAYISMSEKETLEAPYDTNCTDYISLWKQRNGTGPLNEMMCVEECKLNILKSKGLCIDRNVAYPHEERLCETEEYSVTKEMVETCTKQCNQACEDRSYELRIEAANNFDSICTTIWCRSNLAKITIYFKRFRVTKFKYQPKFESVEMFSYIGGYMGMWLGLSLISLFDLFETFLQIFYFPLGRKYWQQKKKGRKMFDHFTNHHVVSHRR